MHMVFVGAGSSILIKDDGAQIEAAKTVSHFATTPMMGVALGRTVSSF